MKNSLMEMSDKILLRKRSIIKTVNDELKISAKLNILDIVHFTNFLTNLIAGIIAYNFYLKKTFFKIPKKQLNLTN